MVVLVLLWVAGINTVQVKMLTEGQTDIYTDSKAQVKELLNQLVVIKLNVGLGTSMGCRYV